MKSLRNAPEQTEIAQRIKKITPESQRLWGRMTPHQMICHLTDGFRLYLGEMTADAVKVPAPRWLIRTVALKLPLPWPHGVKTMPEIDQAAGSGTPPEEFARDVEVLGSCIERFAKTPQSFAWNPHPAFGTLTYREWMRLGYLHCDHHLRQFGA